MIEVYGAEKNGRKMQKLSSLFTFTMQKLSSSIFDNTGCILSIKVNLLCTLFLIIHYECKTSQPVMETDGTKTMPVKFFLIKSGVGFFL